MNFSRVKVLDGDRKEILETLIKEASIHSKIAIVTWDDVPLHIKNMFDFDKSPDIIIIEYM